MQNRTKALALALAAIALSCKPLASDSALKNIYKADDEDSSRRHEAQITEVNWTVKATGCSGILLSPTLVLTANHCKLKSGSQLRSGWSVHTQGVIDLLVLEVLESNAMLDYSIARVKFTAPMPSGQTFPPYIAIGPDEVFSSSASGEGDRLFTVGFPDDKSRQWNMTYAEGQLKSERENRIYFNIGIINGNSGGGILKKENFMLVGIAVGGGKAFREDGWDNNGLDDASSWNYGTPTWAIYQASKVMQEQFPNGRNRELGEIYIAKTKLYLSLSKTQAGASLKVSAGLETESLWLCPPKKYPCDSSTAGAKSLSLTLTGSGRRFYAASDSLSPEQLSDLGIVAFDKSGRVIGQRKVALQPTGVSR